MWLSGSPTAVLAAGDSHEHTQDVCGLTETSPARASHQMDGKDARGWSSSSRKEVTHSWDCAGLAGGTCGWGRAESSSWIAAQHFCTWWDWSTALSVCQDCSGPAQGSTEQVKLPAVPLGDPVGLSASPYPIGN